IITKNIKDESGNFIIDKELMKAVAEATGQDINRITMIPVIFPYIKPDLNLQTWLRSFENGKPFCRGNGEIAERWEEGKSYTVSCPCERYDLPDNDPRKCKIYARLNVIIRDAKQFGGVWVFHTTGQRSVLSLISQLSYFSEQLQGYLSHYVFLLMLNQERVITPDGNISTVYYVNIVYDPDYDTIENTPLHKFITKSMQLQALPEIKERIKQEEKMLEWMPATILAEEETNIEDIQKEFFPDEEVRKIISEITEKEEEEIDNDELAEAEVIESETQTIQTKTAEQSRQQIKREISQGEKTEKVSTVEEIEQEEKARPINEGQLNIIKNNFKNDLSEKTIAKLHTLTFKQGAIILGLLQQKKKDEALALLREWLEDVDTKSSENKKPPTSEENKVPPENKEVREVKTEENTAKATQVTQHAKQELSKEGQQNPATTTQDKDHIINLLKQYKIDIKDLYKDEVLPDPNLDI
ncbi:MAG: hypothetical protein QXM53_04270, partial [Thermofilaceae archaeon]